MAVTVGINWLVKPFSMALLGWLFIDGLCLPWLPADQIESYIAGHPSGLIRLNEERPERELFICLGGVTA